MHTPYALGAAILAGVIVSPAIASAARCSDGSRAPASTQPSDVPPPSLDDTCIEQNIFLMPGAYASYFQPNAHLGPFMGGGVQIAPFQWSHNNDHFGPSQGGVFFQAAFLDSPVTHGVMAMYEGGAMASLERNASRRWVIPYFGATMGGLTQSALGKSAFVYPFGGVHVFWHRDLMVDADAGYHFPFENVDQLRGPRAQLTARFSLW
jgi:hypothetical protein